MAAKRVYDADEPRLVEAPGRRATEVNLNLVWDYPVRWSKYKVLRDLVQNFYDAVGPAEWHRRFRLRVEGNTLHLRADATGFSYEWLLHIGASTKRERPGEFAGHFGEGFKIAALCAARDFRWNIELASRGWDLRVVNGETRIEGKPIRTLAYRVWDGLPERSHTELCLWPFGAADGDVLQAALVSFFYDENPLFGESSGRMPRPRSTCVARLQGPRRCRRPTSTKGPASCSSNRGGSPPLPAHTTEGRVSDGRRRRRIVREGAR